MCDVLLFLYQVSTLIFVKVLPLSRFDVITVPTLTSDIYTHT